MFIKNYEQLTFSDDFMFCKVLQNHPDLCKELLELAIGKPVGDLVWIDKQHPVEISPNNRGVRFDVYAKDDSSVVYDVEMQNAQKDSLPKRTRYVQGLIDLEMLEKGTLFRELKQSYVIFLCDFNLWEKEGKHKYSFRNLCVENPALELDDETEKIFLCTKGKADDISEELRQFLEYVAGGAPKSEFAKRLDGAVSEARLNPRWRKEFMDLRDMFEDVFEKLDKAEAGRKEAEAGRKEAEARAEAAEARAEEEKARREAAEASAEAERLAKEAALAELAQSKNRMG